LVPLSSTNLAPTTRVSSQIARALPNSSSSIGSLATSFCCSDHIVPPAWKTYAAPVSVPETESAPGAPATTVAPEIATVVPKPSNGAPSLGTSFCCSEYCADAAGRRNRNARASRAGALWIMACRRRKGAT
jgi:hypothetical protein